jgi:hypothetical protein
MRLGVRSSQKAARRPIYASISQILPSFITINGSPNRRFSSRTIRPMRFAAAMRRLILAASSGFFRVDFVFGLIIGQRFLRFERYHPFLISRKRKLSSNADAIRCKDENEYPHAYDHRQ